MVLMPIAYRTKTETTDSGLDTKVSWCIIIFICFSDVNVYICLLNNIDPETAQSKATYVVRKNLAGVAIHELGKTFFILNIFIQFITVCYLFGLILPKVMMISVAHVLVINIQFYVLRNTVWDNQIKIH